MFGITFVSHNSGRFPITCRLYDYGKSPPSPSFPLVVCFSAKLNGSEMEKMIGRPVLSCSLWSALLTEATGGGGRRVSAWNLIWIKFLCLVCGWNTEGELSVKNIKVFLVLNIRNRDEAKSSSDVCDNVLLEQFYRLFAHSFSSCVQRLLLGSTLFLTHNFIYELVWFDFLFICASLGLLPRSGVFCIDGPC